MPIWPYISVLSRSAHNVRGFLKNDPCAHRALTMLILRHKTAADALALTAPIDANLGVTLIEINLQITLIGIVQGLAGAFRQVHTGIENDHSITRNMALIQAHDAFQRMLALFLAFMISD